MKKVPLKLLGKILILVSLFPSWAAAEWMDRSHTIFLPAGIRDHLSIQMDMPYFWWNFAIIEPQNNSSDFDQAHALCKQLENITGSLVQKTACPDISSFMPVLKDWSADITRRQMAPSAELLNMAFAQARAKASLPMDRKLLEILRQDPLESYQDLKSLLMKNVELGLKQEKGFFVDATTKRIVIPIQFSFSPQETQKTRDSLKRINSSEALSLVGPHFSAMENESRVLTDVDTISIVGSLIMILQILFIVFTRRFKYVWLIPPVAIGVGGAIGLTVLIFGSIHGLTLSLGTGIIGLALDFGLHSCHNIHWKGVWRANLFGLLTTFAGLLAISLSGIPLLRQMMVFATLGLSLSYAAYYILHSRWPKYFQVQAFDYKPKSHPLKTFAAMALVAMSIYGILFIHPNLNMHQFDYQSAKTRSHLLWLYSLIHKQMPLFSVHEQNKNMFDQAEEQTLWAQNNQIQLTHFKQFIPAPTQQLQFQESWAALCSQKMDTVNSTLFKPFLQNLPCASVSAREYNDLHVTYLKDITSQKNWLTIWFPKSEDQISAIKNYDTKAYSLKDVVQQFPTTLERELVWMLPLSLGLCLLLLWWYYRRWQLSLISLVPFLSGVGFYFTCVLIFGWSFSFISIISLIMVFGFSIDYGIFAANLFVLKNPPAENGVWTCLVLAAFVTLLGFVPLMICHHPVLIHLGQTLVTGTIGTLIGTVWGIPGIFATGIISQKSDQ